MSCYYARAMSEMKPRKQGAHDAVFWLRRRWQGRSAPCRVARGRYVSGAMRWSSRPLQRPNARHRDRHGRPAVARAVWRRGAPPRSSCQWLARLQVALPYSTVTLGGSDLKPCIFCPASMYQTLCMCGTKSPTSDPVDSGLNLQGLAGVRGCVRPGDVRGVPHELLVHAQRNGGQRVAGVVGDAGPERR